MAAVFWLLRLILLFAVLGVLAVSWRTSLVLGALLVADFFAMVTGALPTASFWTQGTILGTAGALLGLLSLGRPREPLWHMPVFAAVGLGILTVSWYIDPESAHDLLDAWPLLLTRVLALPIGMLAASGLIRLGQRLSTARSAGG